MSHYRQIDVRIHNDYRYRNLTDDAKLLFLTLLTHPHMTSVGAIRIAESALAEELQWLPIRLREPLAILFEQGMVNHDFEAQFLCLPNFLKYNDLQNPNHAINALNAFDLLPECGLKWELEEKVNSLIEVKLLKWNGPSSEPLRIRLRERLSIRLSKPLPIPCSNGIGNREREREREREKKAILCGSEKNVKKIELKTQAKEVLSFLNHKWTKAYQESDSSLKPIMGVLALGYTVQNCKDVIISQGVAWLGDYKMEPYLRIKTVFAKANFQEYFQICEKRRLEIEQEEKEREKLNERDGKLP